MKVKTAELIGRALDWAVAIAEGYHPDRPQDGQLTLNQRYIVVGDKSVHKCYWYLPSTEWEFCGKLIERFNAHLIFMYPENWKAMVIRGEGYGETPLIAICRAVVAYKLGDEVDIPDELMEKTK